MKFNMKPCNLCLNDVVPSTDGNKCHTLKSKIAGEIDQTVCAKMVHIFIPEVSMIMRLKVGV